MAPASTSALRILSAASRSAERMVRLGMRFHSTQPSRTPAMAAAAVASQACNGSMDEKNSSTATPCVGCRPACISRQHADGHRRLSVYDTECSWNDVSVQVQGRIERRRVQMCIPNEIKSNRFLLANAWVQCLDGSVLPSSRPGGLTLFQFTRSRTIYGQSINAQDDDVVITGGCRRGDAGLNGLRPCRGAGRGMRRFRRAHAPPGGRLSFGTPLFSQTRSAVKPPRIEPGRAAKRLNWQVGMGDNYGPIRLTSDTIHRHAGLPQLVVS